MEEKLWLTKNFQWLWQSAAVFSRRKFKLYDNDAARQKIIADTMEIILKERALEIEFLATTDTRYFAEYLPEILSKRGVRYISRKKFLLNKKIELYNAKKYLVRGYK